MTACPPTTAQDLDGLSLEGRPVCCRVVPAKVPARQQEWPRLLLHGLGCSARAWGPALPLLDGAGTVYAPDMPGYGQSPGPEHALRMEELGDWAARLLDRLEIERAHIAGHSMGCQVALALARRHPGRVGGMVLLGPTTGSRDVPFARYAAGLALDGLFEPPLYTLTLAQMYAEMGTRRYHETTRAMMEDDPLAHAGEVHAPCLVVRGGHDYIIPDYAARRLTAALPDARYVVVHRAAHAVQFHRPQTFADLAHPLWRRAEGHADERAEIDSEAAAQV